METITYEGQEYEISSEYSRRDFTGWLAPQGANMSNLVIFGSCFSKEIPNTSVFPDNMTGTTFLGCNLDNCFVPEGNTIIGGSHRMFKTQNDGEDWIINDSSEPLEPINKKLFEKLGLSTDPADIPAEPVEIPITCVQPVDLLLNPN